MYETEGILILSDIRKNYGRNCVLKGISLSLQRGKIYGLIGQNGAGKTTLMRIIVGLVFPDSGNIQLDSVVRKKIGCLIETPALYPNLTVEENLNIIKNLKNIDLTESLKDIMDLLELNDISKKVKNCSMGTKQKIGIALALLGEPQLLVLDEPLNGLDPIIVVRLRKYLQKVVKEKNITVLISSHILSEIDKIASDYILINNGEIKKIITREEIEIGGKNENLEDLYQAWLGVEVYDEKHNW